MKSPRFSHLRLLPGLLALVLLACARLPAQTPTDANLGSKLTVDGSTSPATYTFSWWGTSGKSYLVMSSPDLITWNFFPNFNPAGADAALSVQFTTDADKYFFRAVQLDPNDISGLADTDGDGLPDIWEMYYFGNLSQTATGDANGNGVSNLQEYREGTNPTLDYYHGVAPLITIVGGDHQTARTGAFLPVPLEVLVTSPQGTPLVGAPVRFTLPSDQGLLATDPTTTAVLRPALTVLTDANGHARAWQKCP